MPMFSPLVMIIEVPKNPPASDMSASPRMVRGTTSRGSIVLPTTSATAMVWPVASTIEITLNTSKGNRRDDVERAACRTAARSAG